MGCCGEGHNNFNQMRGTRTHGENHNHNDCTHDGTSRIMIVFSLILIGSLAYYFLR